MQRFNSQAQESAYNKKIELYAKIQNLLHKLDPNDKNPLIDDLATLIEDYSDASASQDYIDYMNQLTN
jgi:hypothetical protein